MNVAPHSCGREQLCLRSEDDLVLQTLTSVGRFDAEVVRFGRFGVGQFAAFQ